MLIESQPQQSTTPPTPQLGLTQSIMSSPSPHNPYDICERTKKRINTYRHHHQISLDKNQNTIEGQNVKMRAETQRLLQTFANNNPNNSSTTKSKQQKSVNSSTAQRNANKRTNASLNNNSSEPKCDSMEPKPTKVAKVANNRNSTNSSAKGSQSSPNNQNFRNNCAKLVVNSQIDVKLKTSIDGSFIGNATQPLLPNNPSITSMPEIKREKIEENSCFQSVTVEAIHDFLKDSSSTIYGFPQNNFDFSVDDIKDVVDSNLFEDGFNTTNDGFGDEDFIKKFLDEINESTFNEIGNFGQHLNTITFKGQQMVSHSNNMINGENNTNGLNCNISVNSLNNNLNINPNTNTILNTNVMNSNNFITNSMQTPTNNEMTSYHPIQPRLQPNLMSNIPNRPSIQIMNPSSQPIAINQNTTIRYVSAGNTGTGQTSQLLLQQIPVLPQQTLNTGLTPIQSQTHHLTQQNSQQIQIRVPTGSSMQRMAMVSVVPKTEDVSVQLSIQVPQQSTQLMPNNPSAQVQPNNAQTVPAAAKLKQMAQHHVQQKSHHWVINHSNQNQNSLQSMNQQMGQQMRPQTTQSMVQNQRLVPQTQQQQRPQVMSPETQNLNQNQIHQNSNQTQNYFNPQINQQMYWQHNQQHSQHSQTQQQQIQQTMPQSQTQTQTQPQQTPQQQQLIQQNLQQNQQNFGNYWSHSSQLGQMSGQPSQPLPQQTQHYFNNNNSNNNYNYF